MTKQQYTHTHTHTHTYIHKCVVIHVCVICKLSIEELEKTLESPLDSKEIQLVHPKGDQSWVFIGRTDAETPIIWPPDEKN